MDDTVNIKPRNFDGPSKWNAETLLDATQGHWIVPALKGWIGCNFCIEEKFFNVGDVVFIRGKNKLENVDKIKSYLNKGASGFIVESDLESNHAIRHPVLKVGSVSSALESMAVYHRSRMKAKVIAITGSVGKSTVREILYHLLNTNNKVYRTAANYNLFAGVQLSIVNTPVDSDFAVYEMAIGSPGSLSKSSCLAKPDVVILTDITEAHLQRHISLENIVLEKSRILDALNAGGRVAYFGDSKSTHMIKKQLDKRKITNSVVYGRQNSSSIQLLSSEVRVGNQTINFSCENEPHTGVLNLPGLHNAINALAAISILPEIGVDIDECICGLTKVMPTKGRMEHFTINVENGSSLLINDAFNANPSSMLAAIEYLDLLKQNSKTTRTILVCSDMLELGAAGISAHIELGNRISQSKIDLVIMTGDLSKFTHKAISKDKNTVIKDNLNDLIYFTKSALKPNDIVLVKGSHSTKLYEVSDALQSPCHRSPVPRASYYEGSFPQAKNSCLNPTGGAVFDLQCQNYYSTISIDRVIYPASLSIIFGLCYIYEAISDNVNLLSSEVRVSKRAASVASKWILEQGDHETAKDLIFAAAVCSSNEAMIALAEWHSGSETKFAFEMTRYARKLGLKQSIFRNATGLFNEGHVSSIRDIVSIIKRIKTSFPDLANIFATKEFRFRGKAYNNTNPLLGTHNIDGFKTGRTPKSGFNLAITSKGNAGERIAVVIGCRSPKERDCLSLELLGTSIKQFRGVSSKTLTRNSNDNQFSISSGSDEVLISILGDTYFGEHYDEMRLASGKTSYINKYGYQHSLKNVARFLAGNDLNIVNLETSLTGKKYSPFKTKKSWILGGDPRKTIETLNAYRIDGVLLGNNHTYDYGVDEIQHSVSELCASGIVNIGAGLNQSEACRPMVIDVNIGQASRKLYIFSGYAYNKYEENLFNCYADSGSPGVNNITSHHVLKMISDVKCLDSSAYIVVSPHWGGNYQWASQLQRSWAEKYIDSGADIIVGHGAHMLQEIERIRGRTIIYSLGNFIFNSNGEFRRQGVPPFSLLFQLKANSHDGHIEFAFDLIPIFCANHECGFQPRLTTNEECSFLIDRLGFNFKKSSLYA